MAGYLEDLKGIRDIYSGGVAQPVRRKLNIKGATITDKPNDGWTEVDVSLLSGNVTLPNTQAIYFNSITPGQTVRALTLSATDTLVVGSSGTNGATDVLYDVKTGGAHQFRENNVPKFQIQGDRLHMRMSAPGSTPGNPSDGMLAFFKGGILVLRNTSGFGQLAAADDASTGNEFQLLGGDATGSTGAVSSGPVLIQGGACTNTTVGTSQTGAPVALYGGACNGSSGTRVAGDVYIAGGNANGGTNGNVQILATPGGAKRFESNSTGIAFFGVTPVARASAYTLTSVTTDRTLTGSGGTPTLNEVADVLGTLIADLQAYGLLQ